MAGELGYYLEPWDLEMNISKKDCISICKHLVVDHYNDVCDELLFVKELYSLYSILNRDGYLKPIYFNRLGKVCRQAKNMYSWCKQRNSSLRTSYLLTTLRNISYYNIAGELKSVQDLKPSTMTNVILPKLMSKYTTNQRPELIAFCWHQKILLDHCCKSDKKLRRMMDDVWISQSQGKLLNQIERYIKSVNEIQRQQFEKFTKQIHQYIGTLLSYCGKNIKKLIDLEYADTDDPRIEHFLQGIPVLKIDHSLQKLLDEYLLIKHPGLYRRSRNVPRSGLYVAVLCEIVLTKRIHLEMDLNELINGVYVIDEAERTRDALRTVLGKFNGDFGQIMWSMAKGHIFSSEDNNTSAMALMIHRLPHECISGRALTWGSIHGIGDGSCVDITINKK